MQRLRVLSGPSLGQVGQLPRLWTWLGLDVAAPPLPGDTPAHFSTFTPNKKGLKVDCWDSTNMMVKDKILLGRQGSWLLPPAIVAGSAPYSHQLPLPGAITLALFTLQSASE